MMTTVRRVPHILAIVGMVLVLVMAAFAVLSIIRSDMATSVLLRYR
jgi:hypothetical protein